MASSALETTLFIAREIVMEKRTTRAGLSAGHLAFGSSPVPRRGVGAAPNAAGSGGIWAGPATRLVGPSSTRQVSNRETPMPIAECYWFFSETLGFGGEIAFPGLSFLSS